MVFRTIFQASLVATGFDVCVYIVYEQRGISCTGFRQIGAKPYGDRVEIVRQSCSVRNRCMEIVQSPCSSVRRPRGDDTMIVRSSCSFGHSCTKNVQLRISACVVG